MVRRWIAWLPAKGEASKVERSKTRVQTGRNVRI
jgi:hypothetical protein